jgi:VWFA-related protein
MKKATDLVKATAVDFVRAVRPEDSLALITFSDAPKFEHVLATNRDWSIDAIRKYNAIGGTALYDALLMSLQHLKPTKGRRAVVLLSDGRDENNPGTAPGSTHTFPEVLALQRQVGATFYNVALGGNVDRTVLDTLATQSGGQVYVAVDATALGEQFHRIVEDLRRRYVLSYSSTNRSADGNWRKVEIRPRGDGQVVTSAGGYFAPTE